jgi:hypothetical protein
MLLVSRIEAVKDGKHVMCKENKNEKEMEGECCLMEG